jgi:predicted MFS family arabinose efflux permease
MLAARAGWRIALFVDSGTYFLSALAIGFIRPAYVVKEDKETLRPSYRRVVIEAISVMRRSTAAYLGVLAPAVLVLASTTAYVLGVAMIERAYAEGTMYIGFIAAAAGFGMAAGSGLAGSLMHRHRRSRLIAAWVPAVIVPLAMIALTRNLVLIAVAVTLSGFAAGPVFVSSETAVQEETPARRQATVFAFRDVLMKASALLAAWCAGTSPALIGHRWALAVLLAVWLILWLATRRRITHLAKYR